MDKNFVSRFLKGSAFTTLGTMVTVIFHFLSISLMTRFTTKEVLGLYFLILAVVNGVKILGSLGLDLTLVKFMVSEDEEVQQNTFSAIIWTRFAVMSFFAFLIYLVGATLLTELDPGLVEYQWTLPILFTLMSFRELFFYILQGLKRFGAYASMQMLSGGFKFALIAGLGLSSDMLDLPVLISIEIAMLVVSTLVLLWVIPLRQLSTPRMTFTWDILVRIIRFGFPLYINSVFTFISNRASVFIVGISLSPIGVASFEVAMKIPEGFQRLFNSFSTVFFPSVSSLFGDGDTESAQDLINKTLIILASFTFALVMGALLFSRDIVLLVFSDRYLEVQATFVLLQLSVCLHLLAILMGYSLVSAGVPRKSTQVNVIAMSIELGLNIMLIPAVGYIGAAYSFIIMTFVSQAISYVYLKQVGVTINLTMYVRPYLILIGLAGLYLALNTDAFLIKLLFMGAYAGLSIILIDDVRESLAYLWRMMQRFRLKRT